MLQKLKQIFVSNFQQPSDDGRVLIDVSEKFAPDYISFIQKVKNSNPDTDIKTGNIIVPQELLKEQGELLFSYFKYPQNTPSTTEIPDDELKKLLFDAAFKVKDKNGNGIIHSLLLSKEFVPYGRKLIEMVKHASSEQLNIQNNDGNTIFHPLFAQFSQSTLDNGAYKIPPQSKKKLLDIKTEERPKLWEFIPGSQIFTESDQHRWVYEYSSTGIIDALPFFGKIVEKTIQNIPDKAERKLIQNNDGDTMLHTMQKAAGNIRPSSKNKFPMEIPYFINKIIEEYPTEQLYLQNNFGKTALHLESDKIIDTRHSSHDELTYNRTGITLKLLIKNASPEQVALKDKNGDTALSKILKNIERHHIYFDDLHSKTIGSITALAKATTYEDLMNNKNNPVVLKELKERNNHVSSEQLRNAKQELSTMLPKKVSDEAPVAEGTTNITETSYGKNTNQMNVNLVTGSAQSLATEKLNGIAKYV